MTKSLLVILAAGGTGGHIFPAEALAEELLARGHRPVFMTDTRVDAKHTGVLSHIERVTITSGSPSGSPIKKIKGILKLGYGVINTGWKMYEYYPNAVVGFGGYPSFPPVFVAANRKIPTIIHEQNALLGRVNRYVAGQVTAIATSFSDTLAIREQDRHKVHVVGNPVRSAIRALRDLPYPHLDEHSPINLLVTGGSQGASVFGEVIPAALDKLPPELKARIKLTQQCHKNDDPEMVRGKLRAIGIEAEVSPFFKDLPERLKTTHLVICRSGASTVAELTTAGRPALYIPYPHAMDDHQSQNAKQVVNQGAGWMMKQSEMTAESLASGLTEALQPRHLEQAAAKARTLGQPEAAKKLADLVEAQGQ